MSELKTRSFYLFIVLLIILQQFKSQANECIPRKYNAGSIVCVCNATYCDSIEPLPEKWGANQYVAYTSTKDGLRMKQTIGTFKRCRGEDSADFIISRTRTYQTIMGFGGAMTDSAGLNIASLPTDAQDLLMKQYFGDDGIQYTIVRVPIGGTDFSTRPYSLDDVPGDVNLTHFSLAEEDFKYKIPYIKQAMGLSKTYPIKLMACPWSPPAFMKNNNQLIGESNLLLEYYQLYAEYLTKFLQAYKAEGFDFDILSTQNEPVTSATPVYIFNGVGWFPQAQAAFIVDNLEPTLKAAGFGDIKIITGDDQRYFMLDWVRKFLQNEKATKYISGVGVHWYLDLITPPELLTTIHNLPGFEDKFILYTEACAGAMTKVRGVKLGSWSYGAGYLSNIIDNLNNWVEGWVDWNLVLDLQGGPNWVDNFVDAPIIVNATSGEFLKNPMYYGMAHASKFLVPGSKRIHLENRNEDLKATVFDTPNNQTVIVLINVYDRGYNLSVQDLERNAFASVYIPPKSFITYIY